MSWIVLLFNFKIFMFFLFTVISLASIRARISTIMRIGISPKHSLRLSYKPENLQIDRFVHRPGIKDTNENVQDTVTANSKDKDNSISQFFNSTKGIIVIVVVLILFIAFIFGIVYVCFRKFCKKQRETSDIAQYGQVILDENEPLDQLESI